MGPLFTSTTVQLSWAKTEHLI